MRSEIRPTSPPRPLLRALPSIHAPGQRLGRRLRGGGAPWGVAYDRVRRDGGRRVAGFRPRAIAECRQAEHLVYAWDGTRVGEVFEQPLHRP